MSSNSDQRLPPRQREAEERRSRMTQRRDEMTLRIRKVKKSSYLAQKRGLPSAPAATIGGTVEQNSSISNQFRTLLQKFLQNTTMDSLQQIQVFLASVTNAMQAASYRENNPLVILEQTDQSLAKQFLEWLSAQAMDAASGMKTTDSVESLVIQNILAVLVMLTSLQHQSTSQQGSTTSDSYYGSVPVTWAELVVDTGWLTVLSQISTIVPHQVGNNLTEYICIILGNVFGEPRQYVPSSQKSSWISFLIQAVPTTPSTAAWALTNMIRNDGISLASTYCSDNLLSASLLLEWLQNPTIATQTSWMIASLTAREPEVVLYLCRHLSFPSALVQALANPLAQDQIEPLLEALGNIGSNASMVPPLLTQINNPPLLPLIRRFLLQMPSSRQNKRLLTLTAWLAGCLLVDAGTENHPSTTLAAPLLIPALMEKLGSERMVLEENRELTSALWNALSWPPVNGDLASICCSVQPYDGGMSALDNSNGDATRKGPPPAIKMLLPLETLPRATLQSLVKLVGSNDGDAVLAAVQVLSLLLRWHDDRPSLQHSFVILMQEEHVPDALEHVCDSSLEEAAEVAANLLDEFFDENAVNESPEDSTMDNYDWIQVSAPTAMAGIPFDRGDNGLDMPPTDALRETENNPVANTLGCGRGRGATLPAWMSKK
ncbi:hypothetical protein IV203_015470 [Nitzschia inconspicua]|uniref:Importin subunit alpha n=1 Tax=Nitzschia inconspicua TaxID=303405 RepID=A0A9K3LCQ0_9STRA|nr:hypothetical protein IV203_015470 [Nitzschia inconspicua]